MGRVKELLWEEWYEAERDGGEPAQAKPSLPPAEQRRRREQVWAAKYKKEWKEWKRVRLLLDALGDVWSSTPFDFDDFLREVGSCPRVGYRVVRRDRTLPYQSGNLRWAGPKKKAVEPAGLSADEAAEFLGIARQTVYNNRKYIPSLPGFRTLRFDKRVLEELRASQRFMTKRVAAQRQKRASRSTEVARCSETRDNGGVQKMTSKHRKEG